MEAWYVFQKISYLYIFLTVFTVVFLIFSFFLKKNKGRTRSSNCFLVLGGFFFGLSVLSLSAETYFYFNNGSLFYNKSVFAARTQYKVTEDLDLIEEDISADVVDLGNFFHQEIDWRPSLNAKYSIDQEGQRILLSSTDGKLAYLEMSFTRRLNYPEKIYQVQLSFFIKHVLDSLSYISTFEIINGNPYQHRVFCDTSFQKCENYLLSSYFYNSAGKLFNGFPKEYRARLYTSGQEVLFFKPKFTAVRVYSPLWKAKKLKPIYRPVSRFNIPNSQETANKNLVSVGGVGFSKTSSSKTNGSFYHWDPNKKKTSQMITVAKNISLGKDNLENLKGIQIEYKDLSQNNPMQLSIGLHASGMKFHIPIENIKEKKILSVLADPPSETINFSSSIFLKKDILYLVKRVLGMSFDNKWRYSKAGRKTIVQRRFYKNLNNVKTINFVFNPEFYDLVVSEDSLLVPDKVYQTLGPDDEVYRLVATCNLRVSGGRFSKKNRILHIITY